MTPFDLTGRVVVVTGGAGALGFAMARGLAHAGASVALISRRQAAIEEAAQQLRDQGHDALGLSADVLDPASLAAAAETVEQRWGRLDVLLTAAGGNRPDAVVYGDRDLFGLTPEAFRKVVELNLDGTLLPVQAFAPAMLRAGRGSVITISSMAAQKPLTRVIGYGAAKAAVDNLTRWLAVHMAQTYGEGLRVNAIAPGFFVGEQNRALLLQPDGAPTARGTSILANTPMGRFGEADDLVGTAVWLASDASRFVTGVVVPVDGGYAAFGGV
ncbi:MAG: SDR family oxidoreductase [Trueperaceae bacterium]|nr:MAG: SDR family oxidoreductase [Trueperaceae bacterium]